MILLPVCWPDSWFLLKLRHALNSGRLPEQLYVKNSRVFPADHRVKCLENVSLWENTAGKCLDSHNPLFSVCKRPNLKNVQTQFSRHFLEFMSENTLNNACKICLVWYKLYFLTGHEQTSQTTHTNRQINASRAGWLASKCCVLISPQTFIILLTNSHTLWTDFTDKTKTRLNSSFQEELLFLSSSCTRRSQTDSRTKI